MKAFVPKENNPEEKRIALIPDDAKKLIAQGITVEIDAGLGDCLNIPDSAYESVGALVTAHRNDAFKEADAILRVGKSTLDEIQSLKANALHISFLDPFNEQEQIRTFQTCQTSVLSMEMMPRSTIAQKMDALSSQASLAGYYAVIRAAERSDKIMPMMMTPAGTISPARVFVIGVGVAGLQAIATAKRLGARVEAFDTRPEVEEQVKSLAAKFIKVDLGETGSSAQGYAKVLTKEQLQKQRDAMTKVCSYSDIVITTAQVFGRKAPVIVNEAMVQSMKPGTVVVDLAVASGGNVEGSVAGEEVDINGVRILGCKNLPGEVPMPASQVYSSNLTSLLLHIWNAETKSMAVDPNDEILKGCLVTHQGNIVNETIRSVLEPSSADSQ